MKNNKKRRDFLRLCFSLGVGTAFGCKCTSNQSGDLTDIVSYCSYNCKRCPVFIATKNDDLKAKITIAKNWTNKYQKQFLPEDVCCEGCKIENRCISYFASDVCKLRPCARKRNVLTCAHCGEYPCNYFESGLYDFSRKNLDRIKRKLKS